MHGRLTYLEENPSLHQQEIQCHERSHGQAFSELHETKFGRRQDGVTICIPKVARWQAYGRLRQIKAHQGSARAIDGVFSPVLNSIRAT